MPPSLDLEPIKQRMRAAHQVTSREWSEDAHIDGVMVLVEDDVPILLAEVGALRAQRDELLDALKLAQKWLDHSVPVVELLGPRPAPVIAAVIAKVEG